MPRLRPGFAAFTFCLLSAFVLTALPLPAAKSSEWKDANGTAFKAEPVEVIGPFALFRQSVSSGKRVLLRGLPEESCVRFQRETADRPARAADWSQAKSLVGREFVGAVSRVQDKKLVPAPLTGVPEPEVLVVLFASHNDGESWAMLRNFQPTYRRLRSVFGPRMETVFYGVRHDDAQHRRIATESNLPWLVTDLQLQAGMGAVRRYAPGEGILMLALSRDGVPLTSSRAKNVQEVKKFIDELTDFLRLTDPENAATWADRLHYLNAVRPGQFPRGSVGPELVSNPLRADGLRQRGVSRVEAQLAVAADGSVTAATVAPDRGVPAGMITPLAEALRKHAKFSPALAEGQPVASSFAYALDVPAKDPRLPADLAWARGDARLEVALENWLVLKPVAVPPSVFSTVESVDASGTNLMTEFQVSSEKVSKGSQMNAFNSDWFGADGARNVAPVAGGTQAVNEHELTWRLITAKDGYVDLQTFEHQDYCIGYAYAQLELPQALDGWLGIGSDDGLKIWLNGELVHDRWIRRISQIDDDIVPLKLKAGPNRILIKIQNATGDWSFVSRLRVRAP